MREPLTCYAIVKAVGGVGPLRALRKVKKWHGFSMTTQDTQKRTAPSAQGHRRSVAHQVVDPVVAGVLLLQQAVDVLVFVPVHGLGAVCRIAHGDNVVGNV